MKIARERLLRRHALWQSAVIMPGEGFDATRFVDLGVLGEEQDQSIPYSDDYMEALIKGGKLR